MYGAQKAQNTKWLCEFSLFLRHAVLCKWSFSHLLKGTDLPKSLLGELSYPELGGYIKTLNNMCTCCLPVLCTAFPSNGIKVLRVELVLPFKSILLFTATWPIRSCETSLAAGLTQESRKLPLHGDSSPSLDLVLSAHWKSNGAGQKITD